MAPERPPRYFFALWPSASAAGALAKARDAAARNCGGRAMPTDSLHCTLVFLGEQDEAALSRTMAVADGLYSPAFDLCFDRLEYWPHNRIVWAGASAAPPALMQIAARLHSGLVSAGLGPFSGMTMPHITLLRNARTPAALPPLAAAAWRCGEFVLARSAKKEASSSRYEVIARWPLAGGGE